MKKMNKIVLTLALCVSTQAFGVNVKFQPPFGDEFDFLLFEEESDYKGMLRQVDIANLLRTITVKVAPFVGQGAGFAAKTVPDPEFKAIAKSIQVSSKLLAEAAKSKLFGKLFKSLTQKGYTVTSKEGFKPSESSPRVCVSEKDLRAPMWHKDKTNRKIYVVI